jgi:hypothetical protein
MAQNECHNLQWIAETYVNSPVEAACVAWVDEYPDLASNITTCETGLLSVLSQFSPDVLHDLSWHLTGEAVDYDPSTTPAEAIPFINQLIQARVAAGGAGRLLTTEGGLHRIHLQLA